MSKEDFEKERCDGCDKYSQFTKNKYCKKEDDCYIKYLEEENKELKKKFNNWPLDKRNAIDVNNGRLQKELNILNKQNHDCLHLLSEFSQGAISNMNDVFSAIEELETEDEDE